MKKYPLFQRLLAFALTFCLLSGALIPSASAITHESQFRTGYTITKGIDVSHHQGNINWAKVKKAGVKFALIRCGFTSLSRFSRNTDTQFANNMKNAAANGIKIGIYYFSQAKSTGEAEKEAQYVINLLKNYKSQISLPVFFDEESESSSYRFQWKRFSKAQCTNFALAFCKKIQAAGYRAGVYNSVSTFGGSGAKYDPEKIRSAGNTLWVAHYADRVNNSTYHVSGYTYWQYSSKGKVSGISGNVDMDVWYRKNSTTSSTPSVPSVEKCVEVNDDTSITALQLDQKELSLSGGETQQLSAKVSPSNTNDGVVWTSSDESVAYVDASGSVTGVQSGKAVITAASSSGAVKATCAVTVSAEGAPDEVCTVTYGDDTFSLNDRLGLGAVRFDAARDNVAEVSEDGTVTILNAGVTDITAQMPAPETDLEPSGASESDIQTAETPDSPVGEETSEEAPEDSSVDADEVLPQAEETRMPEETPEETEETEEPLPAEPTETPAPAVETEKKVETAEAETKVIRLVVRRFSLSGAKVTFPGTTCAYTGKARNAKVTSVVKGDKTIPASAYRLYCNNNINRGKATATLIGQGNYGGAVSKGYYIRSNQKIYTVHSTYTPTLGGKVFSLCAKNLSQYGGKLTFKSSNPQVASVSSAGKVTPRRVGIVKITITAAQNSRYNAVKKTVRVNVAPKKVTVSSLSAGRKKLTVNWKTTSCSGYQVQYSTKSNFPSGSTKTKTLSGSSRKKQTLSGLGAKKRYYVRVRAYYHSSNGTVYGAWSAAKSQKTK